jgi:hypothetical protein
MNVFSTKKFKAKAYKSIEKAERWCLMPVILATQEAEIRRIMVHNQPRQIVRRPYLEKPFTKIGLLE